MASVFFVYFLAGKRKKSEKQGSNLLKKSWFSRSLMFDMSSCSVEGEFVGEQLTALQQCEYKDEIESQY